MAIIKNNKQLKWPEHLQTRPNHLTTRQINQFKNNKIKTLTRRRREREREHAIHISADTSPASVGRAPQDGVGAVSTRSVYKYSFTTWWRFVHNSVSFYRCDASQATRGTHWTPARRFIHLFIFGFLLEIVRLLFCFFFVCSFPCTTEPINGVGVRRRRPTPYFPDGRVAFVLVSKALLSCCDVDFNNLWIDGSSD